MEKFKNESIWSSISTTTTIDIVSWYHERGGRMKAKVGQVVQKMYTKILLFFFPLHYSGNPWFWVLCCFRFIKIFFSCFGTFSSPPLSTFLISSRSRATQFLGNWQNSTFHVCTIYFTLSLLRSHRPLLTRIFFSFFFFLKQMCMRYCATHKSREGWMECVLKSK